MKGYVEMLNDYVSTSNVNERIKLIENAKMIAAGHPKMRSVEFPTFLYNVRTGSIPISEEEQNSPNVKPTQVVSQAFLSLSDFYEAVEKVDVAYLFSAEYVTFQNSDNKRSYYRIVIRWKGVNLVKETIESKSTHKPVFMQAPTPVFNCNPYTGYCGNNELFLNELVDGQMLPAIVLTAKNIRVNSIEDFRKHVKNFDIVYVYEINSSSSDFAPGLIVRYATLNLKEKNA